MKLIGHNAKQAWAKLRNEPRIATVHIWRAGVNQSYYKWAAYILGHVACFLLAALIALCLPRGARLYVNDRKDGVWRPFRIERD